jgi:hypothetical protein
MQRVAAAHRATPVPAVGMLLATDGVHRPALPRLAERVRQTTKNRRTQCRLRFESSLPPMSG